MKIRVTYFEPGLCSVHLQPNWFERLLGRDEHDDLVSGSGLQWVWEATGRAVTGDALGLVDCAVTRAAAEERMRRIRRET